MSFGETRWLSFVALALTAQSALSANVLWNHMQSHGWHGNPPDVALEQNYDGGIQIWHDAVPGVMPLNPSMTLLFSGTDQGGSISVIQNQYAINLASGTLWVLMNPGNIVSEETIWAAEHYFLMTFNPAATTGIAAYDGEERSESIELSLGETFYIAFENGLAPIESVYGWVAVSYDGDSLVLSGSAFDADGGPMIVGGGSAIPEPTAALLLLAGGALLALRRQRGAP